MQVSFTAHAPNHSMLTIQAYEEGKQLMEARYGRFDAMKEARHINPYRDGDR